MERKVIKECITAIWATISTHVDTIAVIAKGINGLATLVLTVGLVFLTWKLASSTKELAEEARLSREESVLTRQLMEYTEGIEPYIGKYAEPGKLELFSTGQLDKEKSPDGTSYPRGEGGHLYVNWYGVVFWHPEVGYFIGGYVKILENGLKWSVSGQRYRDGNRTSMQQATVELRAKWNNWNAKTVITQGIQLINGEPPKNEEWEVRVKTFDGEWKKFDFVRYSSFSWKNEIRSRSEIRSPGEG